MWLIVFLILLGVLFLVAELVLLPGISLGALFALICYGSAIYTAFTDYGPFAGGVVVLVIAALSFVATVFSLRSKTWQRFSLKQRIESSSMPLPGRRGEGRSARCGRVAAGADGQGRDRRPDLRGQVGRCLHRPALRGRGDRLREFQPRRAQGR